MPDGKIVSAPYSVVACEKRMGLSGMSFFIGLNQMIEEYSSSFTPPFNNIIHKALRCVPGCMGNSAGAHL
jgi:hypothetical protein